MSNSANPAHVVAVSGCASGIGRAVVEHFAQAGWQCYGIDREPGETVSMLGDVADPRVWADAAQDLESRFGRLDALVNNAGTNIRGSVDEVDLATWERILAVNLTSVLLSARMLPLLRSSRGAIVNVSSGAGLVGVRRGAAYAASKGGVIALTRQMAVDLAADGVRVNVVCPGVVDTPLVRRLAAVNRSPTMSLRAWRRGSSWGASGRQTRSPRSFTCLTSGLIRDRCSCARGRGLHHPLMCTDAHGELTRTKPGSDASLAYLPRIKLPKAIR